MGIVILVAVTVVSGVLWTLLVRNIVIAIVPATTTAVVLFQVIVYLQLGYMDPLWPIAVITSSAICLFVAMLTAVAIAAYRSWRVSRHASKEK